MPSPDPTSAPSLASDESLVAACLAGDRDAFATIVERYQRLLCSLAYSTTGRLSQSEDLAQEAFVEAWRQLPKLREPEKLRAWLCMILRRKVSRLHRNNERQPVHGAASLDEIAEMESNEESTADRAVRAEEKELLWHTLERIPENYRTPLVLFYREHRSIEHVAVALDLTEDAVKQRLSRGRKLLRERMLSFVEGALARSAPSKVFTLGVLAALPQLATPAKAATVTATAGSGAAAAKGGAWAKAATLAGGSVSLSGLISAGLGLRSSLDRARTPAERRQAIGMVVACVGGLAVFLGVLYGLRAGALAWWDHRVALAWVAQALTVAAGVALPWALLQGLCAQRALRTSERQRRPEHFAAERDQVGATAGAYRSRWSLLGVPLVHVRFAHADAGDGPVVGWFAGGDRAYGLIFAWGGLAVAPISVGIVSAGLLTVGSVSFGVVSLGTIAFGGLAVGCAAVGIKALAWLSALGWSTAQGGGFAVARLAAEGRIALAEHVNSEAARAVLADPHLQTKLWVILSLGTVLTLLPVIAYARSVRRRLGPTK